MDVDGTTNGINDGNGEVDRKVDGDGNGFDEGDSKAYVWGSRKGESAEDGEDMGQGEYEDVRSR